MLRLPFLGRQTPGSSKRGFGHRGSSISPIAVDFGRRSVRLLQLSKGETAYPCVAGAELPGWVLGASSAETGLATGGDVTARLHEVVTQCGFSGQACMLALPSEHFQLDTVRLPVMADSELLQSVQFEAADKFALDSTTSVVGHVRLGAPTGGQQDILIMALPRTIVEAAVSPVSAAGLGAMHLEHAAFAALRAVSRQRDFEVTEEAESANYGMVHIEDRVATLIVVKDRLPVLVRCIIGDWAPANTTMHRTGGGTVHTQNARRTAHGADEAAIALEPDSVGAEGDAHTHPSLRWCSLAEEALRCLRHLERSLNGWLPKRLVVTGPAAWDPQAVASMESVCGVQSELAVPIRMIHSPAPCVHGNPWVATIGSAMAHLPSLKGSAVVAAPGEPAKPLADTHVHAKLPATQLQGAAS